MASRLDQVLGALADPTRRIILQRLSKGEARVTDLARPLPMSLNAVSKHIIVLERAGLVRRSRQGREHVISIAPASLDPASKWIDEQRSLWTTRLQGLDALLTAQDEAATQRKHRKRSRP